MSKSQVFNLEKIKDLTGTIEVLQGLLNNVEINLFNFKEKNSQISLNIQNNEFLTKLDNISTNLHNINEKLIKITNQNINKFLDLKDKLIKNYKISFNDDLKKLNISQNTTDIGIYLIENKKISKIVEKTLFISSINLSDWIGFLDSLKQNSLFSKTIDKVEHFYNEIIQEKLKQELYKIPKDIDPILIEDFKKSYLNEPNLTFHDFFNNIESKLKKEELEQRKKIIDKTKEKEILVQLKKTQDEQQMRYQEYLKYSPKEFQRRQRKSKRKSLSEIESKPKNVESKEISEEIIEKIEKFKSGLDYKFDEEFLVQKDDQKDPLDLVRERKKKKEEEYTKFLAKFEKDDK